MGTLSFDNVNPLKEDSNILQMMESMPSNQYMHIYLAEKKDKFSNEEDVAKDEVEAEDGVEDDAKDVVEDGVEAGHNVEDGVETEDTIELANQGFMNHIPTQGMLMELRKKLN
ncbi:hypothetical protein V6N13_098861 [Hibiscus sabdariffa]